GALHHPHRRRCAPAAEQRRHRPDHPCGLPQARDPDRVRGRALRRLAQRPGLRAQQARVRRGVGAGGRSRLRHRVVAGARRVGSAEPRLPRGRLLALRRHLPRELRQGRTPRRPGRREGRAAALGPPGGPSRLRGDGRPRVQDGPCRRGCRRDRGLLRHRRLHPLAPARGPRRHRHHARARGRRDGVRGRPSLVEARDGL
ncbi:MAG: 3-isopropylmalate dehydratase small subunit, partial [uncultured Nocardioides sp.]